MIKVITNMLAFIHLVAVGEALMLAKQGGVPLETAYEVIRASSGNSFVHETESQVILNGSYDIGFTWTWPLKDLGFALRPGTRVRGAARARGARRARRSRAHASSTAARPGRARS